MSPEAASLWKACLQYSVVAGRLNHLGSHPELYKAWFLLPLRREEEVEILFQVGYALDFLLNSQSVDSQLKSIVSGHQVEQYEARLENARKKLREMLPRLTQLQQEIVREVYLDS
jgi:hypothetical protein